MRMSCPVFPLRAITVLDLHTAAPAFCMAVFWPLAGDDAEGALPKISVNFAAAAASTPWPPSTLVSIEGRALLWLLFVLDVGIHPCGCCCGCVQVLSCLWTFTWQGSPCFPACLLRNNSGRLWCGISGMTISPIPCACATTPSAHVMDSWEPATERGAPNGRTPS